MTKRSQDDARTYLQRSLESQRKLGYSGTVSAAVLDDAVAETARAIERLRKATQRRAAA
jgi:hypothetical protein